MVVVIDFQIKMIMRSELQNERMLAEAIPDGIIVLSYKDTINWWNYEAQHLLGLNAIEHQSKPISSIIPQKQFQKLKQNSGKLILELPQHNDMRLSLILRPYWANQQLLIMQDITRTFRLESMRQDFIANVSHELRTPLTVFHGYLELLNDYKNIDEKKFAEILQHMSEQSERMERLVQDLLLLSRLESDQPDLESHQQVAVASMLKNICDDAKKLSGKKQHQFYLYLDETLYLAGQPEELRSAFSNLIYNAVHYTPARGKIEVFWYRDERGKHMKVIDTGIGIPAKYIPRITQRFYRVDKARSYHSKGGTGLGLAIVKHVLLRHNGHLFIQSEVNEGSMFCCTFLVNDSK